jgi:hypothetical protein
MNILGDFRYGVGCGAKDLRISYKTLARRAGGETLNNSMLLDEYMATSIYEDTSDPLGIYVIPGYCYIGDREIYVYNDKITEILPVITDETGTYIELTGRPDGIMPMYWDKFDTMYIDEEIEYGYPPLLLYPLSSQTITDLRLYTETIISSTDGISISDEEYGMGYSYDEYEYLFIGEVDNYPFYFSPLERFAKCPEYWREESIAPLNYNTYEYDLLTNRVYINVNPNSEYIMLNYEGKNEPFQIDMSLSFLRNLPENFIVTLETNTDTGEETDRINIYCNTVYSTGTMDIVIELLSTTGNRLIGKEAFISLKRKDIRTIVDSVDYTSEAYLYNSDYCIDIINMDPVELWENDTYISSDHRIDGNIYISGVGYLKDQDDNVGNNFILNSDNNGIIRINYIPPVNLFNVDLELQVTSDEISEAYYFNIRSNDTVPVYSNSIKKDTWKYEYVQCIHTSTTSNVKIIAPVDAISMGDILLNMFITSLSSQINSQNINDNLLYPIGVEISGDNIICEYDLLYITNGIYFIKYLTSSDTIKGDGSRNYE